MRFSEKVEKLLGELDLKAVYSFGGYNDNEMILNLQADDISDENYGSFIIRCASDEYLDCLLCPYLKAMSKLNKLSEKAGVGVRYTYGAVIHNRVAITITDKDWCGGSHILMGHDLQGIMSAIEYLKEKKKNKSD